MTRIYVIGEALIDRFHQPEGIADHPGGSPLNVAYTLGKLGAAVTFVTSIGDDDSGDVIRQHLAGLPIHVENSPASAGTSVAHCHISPDGNARYEFDIAWDISTPSPFDSPAVIHVGSIAAMLEPGSQVVSNVVNAKNAQQKISFDPNVRPQLFVGGEEAARQRALDILQHSDYVKLSDEDAAWLKLGETSTEIIDNVFSNGADLCVLTQGAAGMIVATHFGQIRMPSRATQVIDTVGAGDSVTGMMLYLLTREPGILRQAAGGKRLADWLSTVAAITVSRKGANPPSLAEVRAALGES